MQVIAYLKDWYLLLRKRPNSAAKRCIDDPSENNKREAWPEAWAVATATWAAWANPAETEKIKSKIIEKGLEILKK
jgi:hypothetical protein